MINILANWLIFALAILISSYVIPGVTVEGFMSALVVALVLGILNAFIKPFLLLITLPVNILTLGLFTFIINAFLILIAAALVPGFMVAGLLTALLFGIVLSVIMFLMHTVFK